MKTIKQNEIWLQLSIAAWSVRENAYILGNTKVGAAVYSSNGNIYTGCNVEHKFRSHDIHAEVNAISNMISAGESKFTHIIIAAERNFFTPCGSCMDWIMQFCDEECLVGFQSNIKSDLQIFNVKELMPYYPF